NIYTLSLHDALPIHGIHNAAREIEITQVAGRFIGIKTGACGKRVIIKQSTNLTPLSLRIRVCDYVEQAVLRIPTFREDAIERARSEEHTSELQSLAY